MALSEVEKARKRESYRADPEPQKKRSRENWAGLTAEEKRERRAPYKAGEKHKEARRRYFAKLRREVVKGYGGACVCCGTTYFTHLTIDHVHGGGTQQRKQLCSWALYIKLRREGFPPDYQCLCFNCNWAKHAEGECGCQKGGD